MDHNSTPEENSNESTTQENRDLLIEPAEHEEEIDPKAKSPKEGWIKRYLSHLSMSSVHEVLDLLDRGVPIPFIAFFLRPGGKQIRSVDLWKIRDLDSEWQDIQKKREHIIREIETAGKLTPDLRTFLDRCHDLDRLEDAYAPFKLKRQTLATHAREGGLEPLAIYLWQKAHDQEAAEIPGDSLEAKASGFIKTDTKYADLESVLKGVQDILVERIAESFELRSLVRSTVFRRAKLKSLKGPKAKPNSKYSKYFDYQEPIGSLKKSSSAHRYLAIRKGWMEDELVVSFERPDEGILLEKFEAFACPNRESIGAELLIQSARLALKGNVFTVMENEAHRRLKESAEAHVIEVLCENYRRKLLRPGIGRKQVLGIDPGTDGHCSLALLESQGKPLIHFKLNIKETSEQAKTDFLQSLEKMPIEAIAIAHSSSSKIVRDWFKALLIESGKNIPLISVHEHSANIYSSSPAAKEEFPDLDLNTRRALFVGRYLQDPLTAITKIDLKYLSLGEFQHEVNQSNLKQHAMRALDYCVNFVGIDPNHSPSHLIAHVCGLDKELANALESYRTSKGKISNRAELASVPGVQKSLEFCSGFLRFESSTEALDQTFIRPEHYGVVKEFCAKEGILPNSIWTKETVQSFLQNEAVKSSLPEFTIEMIAFEMEHFGEDPRGKFVQFEYHPELKNLEDLKRETAYHGIVTNITSFGAFVDVGIEQDGLVHISELSDLQIKNPFLSLFPGDEVVVWVSNVSLEKKQISLTTKDPLDRPTREPRRQHRDRSPRAPRPPRRPMENSQPTEAQANGEHSNARAPNEFRGRRPRADDQRGKFGARKDRPEGKREGDRLAKAPQKPKKPQRDPKTGAIVSLDDGKEGRSTGMKLPSKAKPHTFNPFAGLANLLKDKDHNTKE